MKFRPTLVAVVMLTCCMALYGASALDYRLIVNLDWGRELYPPKQSLRSEPADFQRGEVEVDGQNLYFDQWNAKTEVERNPVTNPN